MTSDLFVVVVLYKMLPDNSVSFRTLQESFMQLVPGSLRLKVLLYDNTPGGQEIGSLDTSVVYERASHNAGLAGAYNRALELAAAERFTWLLTLDQDTSLPVDFLPRLLPLIHQMGIDTEVAAIVPQILSDSRMVSPNWFRFGAFPNYFPRGFVGIPRQATWAFNSASTVRVSALRQIGGYSNAFWLDNADSYLFFQLKQYQWKVFVAGDIRVEHDFSMLDIKNRMSLARYENILLHGGAFWDMYMNWLARLEHTFRLFVRLVYKHPKNGDSKEMRYATKKALFRRLFNSKAFRLARWAEDVEARNLSSALPHNPAKKRPRLSVYIDDQSDLEIDEAKLRILLSQLRLQDEVVIATQDLDAAWKSKICDSRLNSVCKPAGVPRLTALLKGLHGCSGEIILVAQSVLFGQSTWIDSIASLFLEHPELELVAVNGTPSSKNQWGKIGSHSHSSDFESFFDELQSDPSAWGIAFRTALLPLILDYPKTSTLAYQTWIILSARLSDLPILHIHQESVSYFQGTQKCSDIRKLRNRYGARIKTSIWFLKYRLRKLFA